MRKVYLICLTLFFTCTWLTAVPDSMSMSPITLLILTEMEEDAPPDFVWLSFSFNYQLEDRKEIGIGATIIPGYFDIKAQGRKYNNENHSGFFYGPFALLEYRKCFWEKDSDSSYRISPDLFDSGRGMNQFHSVGLRLGMDAGFRIHMEQMAVTPYIGVAIPLFYCFDGQGSTEIKENWQQFYLDNLLIRAVDFGINIDFKHIYLD